MLYIIEEKDKQGNWVPSFSALDNVEGFATLKKAEEEKKFLEKITRIGIYAVPKEFRIVKYGRTGTLRVQDESEAEPMNNYQHHAATPRSVNITHFLTITGNVPCNRNFARNYSVVVSGDPQNVTCKNCKRTRSFISSFRNRSYFLR